MQNMSEIAPSYQQPPKIYTHLHFNNPWFSKHQHTRKNHFNNKCLYNNKNGSLDDVAKKVLHPILEEDKVHLAVSKIS